MYVYQESQHIQKKTYSGEHLSGSEMRIGSEYVSLQSGEQRHDFTNDDRLKYRQSVCSILYRQIGIKRDRA